MRRMYSENQLIELVKQYAEVSPEDIQDMIDAGEVNLDGKYVKVIDAPSSTTLDDDTINLIVRGVFVNGDFAGYKSPQLFAAHKVVGSYVGNFICGYKDGNIGRIYGYYSINEGTKKITFYDDFIYYFTTGLYYFRGKNIPNFPANTAIAQYIIRKDNVEWYIPVAQDNITSGDVVAVTSNLGKALIDHLDVVINGYMARYEYTQGNYVVYSSKTEADSGAKLQVNMISYNTTNGELSFNQMTFTPDN